MPQVMKLIYLENFPAHGIDGVMLFNHFSGGPDPLLSSFRICERLEDLL